MLKQTGLLALLLAVLCAAVSPASAYVELVLAPSGYTPGFDENGNLSNPPEIFVVPSDQFILELSIWTDETGVQTGGIAAYIYFNPDLVKVKDENGNITDNPVNPVDDFNSEIIFSSMMPKNEGNNVVGKIEYEQQTGLTPAPILTGKTHLGYLEFHCESDGEWEIYPGTDSSLSPGDVPGNLLTSYHGTVVSTQIIPEPATLLLLGTGLFGLIGAYKNKKKNV